MVAGSMGVSELHTGTSVYLVMITSASTGGGSNFSIGITSAGHGYRHGGYRDHRWDRPRNRCNPRKAVRKAKRRGVRRAHVIRVGKRGVVVAGRKWGERVVIGFGRNRSCPVRFVNAR